MFTANSPGFAVRSSAARTARRPARTWSTGPVGVGESVTAGFTHWLEVRWDTDNLLGKLQDKFGKVFGGVFNALIPVVGSSIGSLVSAGLSKVGSWIGGLFGGGGAATDHDLLPLWHNGCEGLPLAA